MNTASKTHENPDSLPRIAVTRYRYHYEVAVADGASPVTGERCLIELDRLTRRAEMRRAVAGYRRMYGVPASRVRHYAVVVVAA